MTAKAKTDWEKVEGLYRAGILSVREIGAAQGVSHTAIQKRAKLHGWERDLKARIRAKADALVARREVSAEVASRAVETERIIVDANAQLIADVRMSHRSDIGRYRRLANALLEELEAMSDGRGLFSRLGELLEASDDSGTDKLSDAYKKVLSLPGRTKNMRELAETLKTLIGLEREAYSLGQQSHEETFEQRLARLVGGET